MSAVLDHAGHEAGRIEGVFVALGPA